MDDNKLDKQQYDTIYSVDTPEGIALSLSVAGPVPRGLAWLVDFLIRMGAIILIAIILSIFDVMGLGLTLIIYFIIEWFYPIYFEVFREGATPGKKMLGIYVVHDNGTPINFSSSVIRNLLRAVDFLPLLYSFGLISMLVDRHFRRLGDLVAGTVVIYRENKALSIANNVPDLPSEQAEYVLTLNEQQAILAFAQRSQSLTTERADELARLTGPLTDKRNAPARYLQGVANYLSGK